VFGDERLKALVALALENNRDLRVAALNVELTRAQHRIQRAELLPTVGASASATRQHLGDDLSPSGEAQTTTHYTVGLGVTAFELDLFGRVRSLSAAALEQYLATEQARRSALRSSRRSRSSTSPSARSRTRSRSRARRSRRWSRRSPSRGARTRQGGPRS
jgi:multidrug efflux system outer membrane protein